MAHPGQRKPAEVAGRHGRHSGHADLVGIAGSIRKAVRALARPSRRLGR
jgi:hypothetical protein